MYCSSPFLRKSQDQPINVFERFRELNVKLSRKKYVEDKIMNDMWGHAHYKYNRRPSPNSS